MDELRSEFGADGELEQELRAALRPLPAPAGFADRLIARSRELPQVESLPQSVRHRGLPQVMRWALAAVLLLAVSFGGFFEHQRQRRIAGEHARDQVLLALRITTVTLRAVRNHVDKSNTN
jgi:hypothetical protein